MTFVEWIVLSIEKKKIVFSLTSLLNIKDMQIMIKM